MPESILQKQLKKEQPFESIELETFLNLLRSHNMIAAAPGRLMKRHGLSSAQYNILKILDSHHGEGLPCLEIVQQMVTRVPDITRLVDRLAEAQLVERNRSESDRRVVMISITPKGRQLVETIRSPLLEIHKQNLGHMTEDELFQLNQLLVKARMRAEATPLCDGSE
ncbi:MarR family transcriptional regulator [Bremerella sp. JC817]|uniref:MarR family winged helix-turn-helix transcriptional regulator n=1 Tax=Bremerella sp. JC817 TaxID=3231756 RepID=UPI00345A0191